MLLVDDLRKRFGEVVALDGVGFSVAPGQLVGFLGPNGAGKTTTMRAIMGLVSVDGGAVTWKGAPLTSALRRRIGYMPAERGMYPKMRVHEHVVYFARLAGMERGAADRAADRWLERVGLADRAGTEVQELSSGNQQRVQLALAMVNDPDILVLDEPFSGLDPVAVDVLKDVLLERVADGAALLFSSHQLDLVEDISREVVIIDQGRVVLEGRVEEIRDVSPWRYVDVTFAEAASWAPATGDLLERDSQHMRVRVSRDVNPAVLLADAERAGRVTAFAFAPPPLSDVFLSAVGRRAMEPDPVTVASP